MKKAGIGQRLQDRLDEMPEMSVKKLARIADLAPSTLYDLLRGDSDSSTKLHALCTALGLNIEWVEHQRGPRLIADLKGKPPTSFPVHLRSEQAARFAEEWDKLEEPARTQIQIMVESLVAAQIRSKRDKGKRPPPKHDRPTQ